VIKKGEEIRHSMSFVRENQKQDYTKILMLMVEGYLQTNQINKAEVILQEVEKISPESEEVIWLRCKMLHVKSHMLNVESRNEGLVAGGKWLGEEKFEIRNPKFETSTNDQNSNDQNRSQEIGERKFEARNSKFETRGKKEETGDRRQEAEGNIEVEKIRSSEDFYLNLNLNLNLTDQETEARIKKIINSRVVELKKTRVKKTIYFLDVPVIVIQLGEKFRGKIKNKHLLQVFVDGWIYFEQYLSDIEDKVEVKVEDGERKKVEVEIKIR
jgi:hypothetical protein